MKIVLATQNQGKLRELQELAGACAWLTLELAPPGFNPEETGTTFLENAVLKAKVAASMTGMNSLADDSGIEVEALGNAPGVYSARYCEGTDYDRRQKLLRDLAVAGSASRRARFVCCMALVSAEGEILTTTEGRWEGEIVDSERGANGFGYDPLFLDIESGHTAAELAAADKNKKSHRGKAWASMLNYLNSVKQFRTTIM